MSTDAGHGDAVHSGKYLIGRRVRKWFERDGHGANYLGTVTSVGWNKQMKEMAEIQYDDGDEECLMVDEVIEILVTDCDNDSDSNSDCDSDSPTPSSVARTQRCNSRRQSTHDRTSKAVVTHTENLDRVEEQGEVESAADTSGAKAAHAAAHANIGELQATTGTQDTHIAEDEHTVEDNAAGVVSPTRPVPCPSAVLTCSPSHTPPLGHPRRCGKSWNRRGKLNTDPPIHRCFVKQAEAATAQLMKALVEQRQEATATLTAAQESAASREAQLKSEAARERKDAEEVLKASTAAVVEERAIARAASDERVRDALLAEVGANTQAMQQVVSNQTLLVDSYQAMTSALAATAADAAAERTRAVASLEALVEEANATKERIIHVVKAFITSEWADQIDMVPAVGRETGLTSEEIEVLLKKTAYLKLLSGLQTGWHL